jgi:hypothetical protein
MQTDTIARMETNLALDTVTDIDLAAIKRTRAQLEAIKEECNSLAEELRQKEEDVIWRIESGAYVMGEACVVTRRRQNISWLTVVKRQLGEEGVLEARDAWPTTFYRELRLA